MVRRAIFFTAVLWLGLPMPAFAQTCDGGHTIEFYGGAAGGANNTPAVAAARTAQEHRLCFYASGGYYFTTRPPTIDWGVEFVCLAPSRVSLNKTYSAGSYGEGFLEFYGGGSNGGGITRCAVVANSGSGGSMIKITSPLGSPASYLTFSNIVVTYAGTGTYDLCVDGEGEAANTSAQGIRSLTMSNLDCFQSPTNYWGLYFLNLVSARFENVYVNGSFYVGGWRTPTTSSTTVMLSNVEVGEALYVESTIGLTCGSCNVYRLYLQPDAVNGSVQGFFYLVYNSSASVHVLQ